VFTPWFAGGVILALVLWAPNLWWQYQHDWPQIALFRSLGASSHDVGSTITWLPFQFLITGPVGAAVWVAGLYLLLRQPEAHTYRAIGLAYVVLAVVLAIAAGDKQYYVAGLYVPLWGAGARPLEGWLARHQAGFARPIAVVGFALTSVLAPGGAPRRARELARERERPEPRARRTGRLARPGFSSGRRVAIDPRPKAGGRSDLHLELRRSRSDRPLRTEPRSPERVQRAQQLLWWGPPPATTRTLVAVGFQDRAYLESMFGIVRRVGTISNPWNVENQEHGLPMWIVSDPKQSWHDLWEQARHYD
jgi:hypothetical protein